MGKWLFLSVLSSVILKCLFLSVLWFSLFEYGACFVYMYRKGVWPLQCLIYDDYLQCRDGVSVSMYKHAQINLLYLFCFGESSRQSELPRTEIPVLCRERFCYAVTVLLTVKGECWRVELEISFSRWRCWRTDTQWVTWSYSIFCRSSASSSSRARCSKSWKRKKQNFVIINSFSKEGRHYVM